MVDVPLSKLARDFAAEINYHDWVDAPYRADRAGHDRGRDGGRRSENYLSPQETESVRMNVMWVVAQVLSHHDPNLDVYRFAEACGVDTRTSSGRLRSGAIPAGLRTDRLGRRAGPMHVLFCHVCDRAIDLRRPQDFDRRGNVRREGIVPLAGGDWVWGPVPVHEECRTDLVTPYDSLVGSDYRAQFEGVDYVTAAREQALHAI